MLKRSPYRRRLRGVTFRRSNCPPRGHRYALIARRQLQKAAIAAIAEAIADTHRFRLRARIPDAPGRRERSALVWVLTGSMRPIFGVDVAIADPSHYALRTLAAVQCQTPANEARPLLLTTRSAYPSANRLIRIPHSHRRPTRLACALIAAKPPAAAPNQRPNSRTHSNHPDALTASRAKIGGRSSEITPRFPARS
jgi:hypothetical protein